MLINGKWVQQKPNYYNEIEPFAAQWTRNLIAARHIADGDVDERSIVDVRPEELVGYTQCHFFAGIGVWSYALRLAGWPDDRPVWTGSCPCQSFSSAGKQAGFSDPRHLWPHWFRLIRECRPPVIFGEQVSAAIRLGWLDLVQSDLEGEDYAVGSAVLGACSVGAPHIRQRLWFVADTEHSERWAERESDRDAHGRKGLRGGSDTSDVALSELDRPHRTGGDETEQRSNRKDSRLFIGSGGQLRSACKTSGVAQGDADDTGLEGWGLQSGDRPSQLAVRPAGPVNGFWADAIWLYCRDGKWRPTKPGIFPVAHGSTSRVGRLRATGNAISPEVAEVVIRAYMNRPENGQRV